MEWVVTGMVNNKMKRHIIIIIVYICIQLISCNQSNKVGKGAYKYYSTDTILGSNFTTIEDDKWINLIKNHTDTSLNIVDSINPYIIKGEVHVYPSERTIGQYNQLIK